MSALKIIIAVLIIASPVLALDNGKTINTPVTLDLPDTQLRVHAQSRIYFSVTNYGFIGSQGGDMEDYENVFTIAPGAEFPAGSNIDYLFQGAIWIGATIDTLPPQNVLDTLVSIGNDGWWGDIFELFPTDQSVVSMWRDSTVADEEIYAVFSDTCTGFFVSPDPNDARAHIPMGIEVVRHSMGWTAPIDEDIFILNYTFRNMYDHELNDVWIGIYYDGDVFHESQGGSAGAQHDLNGFLPYGEHGIAWLIDNDGDPDGGWFDYRSPRNVMGMMYLGSSETDFEVNYNWWISNTNSVYDWGPRRLENGNDPFPGGGMGTPGGDKAKYHVMSNGETDYDQAYCNLTRWQNEGWIPRAAQAADLADGYDTRFLISFGAFDLAPGEVDTLTIAYIGGENLHNDPNNFANNLSGQTNIESSINEFYSNLDFSDLLVKADRAVELYDLITGIDNEGNPLPQGFELRQNYPNPFNASTTIEYSLSQTSDVRLSIYNLLGQKIATLFDGTKRAGEHRIIWNAGDLPSGIYFARLDKSDKSSTMKLVLLR